MLILIENINILACYSAGIRKIAYLYRRIRHPYHHRGHRGAQSL